MVDGANKQSTLPSILQKKASNILKLKTKPSDNFYGKDYFNFVTLSLQRDQSL